MGVKPGGAWWILGMGAISTHGEEPKYPDAGPVTSFMLTPSGTSVTMSWMPPTPLPGVVPPVGYVVKLEETGETVDVTDTNFIWEGLQIDTSYCFSVYSKSELGTLSAPVTDCVVTLKEVGSDDAAQLTHIGESTFAISNTTRGIFEYYLSRSDTDFSQASLIANPSSFTVTRNAGGDKTPYYVLTTYPGVTETSLMQKTSFVCTAITSTNVKSRKCDPCTPHCEPGCGGPGSPTCNPPGVDSDSCYSCCWGCGPGDPRVTGQCCCSCSPHCYDVYTPTKDPVPSGFVERYGEWVQMPSTTRMKLSEMERVIPFSPGDWPEDYYFAFPTPEQTIAPIEMASEDNPNPKTGLVFDYKIFMTFFDEDGNIYLNVDTDNEPECFIFVKQQQQEVWIQNLPTLQKGTYEIVWLGSGVKEELPHTDKANTYTLIKEVSGNVG